MFLNRFDVLILKIIFLKKYYFNVFPKKITLKVIFITLSNISLCISFTINLFTKKNIFHNISKCSLVFVVVKFRSHMLI